MLQIAIVAHDVFKNLVSRGPGPRDRQISEETLVHHSDRGVQYVSIRYTERLSEVGITPSVGSVGDSYPPGDRGRPG